MWSNEIMQIERIHTLDDPRLEAFTGLTDPQLRNRLEPEKGIFIAESEKVIKRALAVGCTPISFLMEEKWLAGLQKSIERAEGGIAEKAASESAASSPSTPVFLAARTDMERLTGYDVTRGALAAFRRPPLPTVEQVCKNARRIAVLEDITNTVNIGSIFRAAAALGIDAVLLTPGCCNPLYRRALRVSMGNALKIPWTYIGEDVKEASAHGNVARAGGWCETGMKQLQQLGFQTVALALRDDSVDLDDPALKSCDKLAIVLGTEGEGLSDRTIAECDFVARIPMKHDVDSLNVAAASAVAFWELRDRCHA